MVEAAARFIKSRSSAAPRILIVLGSGLGGFSQELGDAVTIPYSEIPGWPVSSVKGHAGRLAIGTLGGLAIAVMEGRAHLYEGYTAAQVTFGVRVLAELGVRALVVTCACGGIHPELRPGQLVLIRDHINLQGESPLTGSQFVDMSHAYSAHVRQLAAECASVMGIELGEGIYAAVRGPNYESPAEIRFLETIGADLVGMSVVAEVIAARALGLDVLGIACVTNAAAGLRPHAISQEEVLETGVRARTQLELLLAELLPRLMTEA